MRKSSAPRIGFVGLWTAVLLNGAGCVEPRCPRGYDQRGDTCYRIKDAGPDGAAVDDSGDDGPLEDAMLPALRPDADSTEMDGGTGETDPALDAMVEDTEPSARDDGQAPDDATPDAGAGGACSPSSCQHGGTCSQAAQGASCDCTDTGYTGAMCETDVDECASINSCSNAAYPCVQTEAPGYTCQGQFADWPMPEAVLGSKVKPDYDTTSVAKVVIDKVTGLAWQATPPLENRLWEEAKSYCKNLDLGGWSDWRLPTKIELESIVDDTKRDPSINRDAFPDAMPVAFFTASPVGPTALAPWLVEFGAGLSWPLEKDTVPANVRCVRTARRSPSSSPSARYTFGSAAGRDTVTDTRTGLVWERGISPTQVDWDGARKRCPSLGALWRVPTKRELLTLVDPTIGIATPPTIDLNAFPDTSATTIFWSSSFEASSVNRAWAVSPNGSTGTGSTDLLHYVRCVR